MKRSREPDSIGTRLKAEMKRQKVGLAALAVIAGVHEKTVSKWRSDNQKPGEAELELIAKHLGVTPRFLRYGENEAVADAEGSPSHVANPMLRRRLPPRAYEFVYGKLAELESRGLGEEEILRAEQIFLTDDFAALNKARRGPMTGDDWVKKVNADWRAIDAYLSPESE